MPKACRIRRALLSVFDKTGLAAFARALHEEFGIELISTGGTAQALRAAGLPVTLVEEITGFPEMLDGRVKTLHPKIHAAILAERENPEHMRQLAEQGIAPIDMVVVNLYPFERTIATPGCTFEQAIEMIDIGGPCLLRAAAKNHRHVVVIPGLDFGACALDELRAHGDVVAATRAKFAAMVFRSVSCYDVSISTFLAHDDAVLPEVYARWLVRAAKTRYGENPGQVGALYFDPEGRLAEANLVIARSTSRDADVAGPALAGGQELSFNNYADASAALELCTELTRAARRQHGLGYESKTGATEPGPQTSALGTEPETRAAACFVKHTNACGVAVDADPVEAYRRAYLGDPNAALGGILAVNFRVDAAFAEVVLETYARFGKPLRDAGAAYAPGGFFLEVWLAPSFDDDAVRMIRGALADKPKKDWGQRVRLLAVGDMGTEPDPRELDFKRIAGGVLMQTRDLVGLNEEQWKVVTARAPTEGELDDLRLAWLVCKHTRSNAITICKGGMLIGNGAGQMSRVMSCRIATWLAGENGHETRGAVAASDAFFPFCDGPEVLMDAGVRALIQPGGGKRDDDVIAACNERDVAMIFTGTRHFRH